MEKIVADKVSFARFKCESICVENGKTDSNVFVALATPTEMKALRGGDASIPMMIQD